MGNFKDRVVLVTGAGQGTGREIAAAFAVQGAQLALNDLTPVNLDPTLTTLQKAGGQVKGYLADVAKKIPVQTMIAQIVQDWGRIDILVNTANVKPLASLLEMDEWDWQRTLNVNLTGPFLTTQIAGRVMRDLGGGVIINIGPGQGDDLEDRSAYIASKTGLIGFTRASAIELAPDHIRVNAVCPGGLADAAPAEAGLARWPGEVSPDNLNAPADLPGLVLFLCSPAASHLTGQIIPTENDGDFV